MIRSLLALAPLLLLLPGVALAAGGARIAVMDFTSASTDPQYGALGKGLQSMLTTDLAQVEAFTLVERERLRDITAELELAGSQLVDSSTAARVGKLAGASHLLVGSYTIVGSTMRLDARLVSVEDGDVVLARQIDGETDAFFELEQDLVKSLVGALGVDLAPKERAGIRRIHTADFAAFAAFSDGIDRFDAKAYDDALVALRDAAKRDEDFKLARVTLKEYEEIIDRLRARSASLEAARDELERLEKAREVGAQAEVLARLWAIAEGEAADVGDVAEERRRPGALYLLAVAYGNVGRNRGKLHRLRSNEDRWAMDRSADALHRAFYEQVAPQWPTLPLVVTDRFWRGLPDLSDEDGPPKPFAAQFGALADHLFEHGADYPENRRNYLLDDLRYPRDMARRLHLDRREEVALMDSLFEQAKALDPPEYWVESYEERLAEAYREVLRLDDATRLLSERAGRLHNPHAIEGIAREIEVNRDYQRLLDRSKNKALMREWLLLAQAEGWSKGPIVKFGEEQLSGPRPTRKGLAQLSRFRDFPNRDDQHLLLGDHPAWAIQAKWALRTGPRVDPLRAGSLRYYQADAGTPPMVLLDGVPTDRLEASFRLDFDPADDWWPPKLRPSDEAAVADAIVDARPTVRFVFGVRDVQVDKAEDPATGERVVHRPTRLWAVRFAGDSVALEQGVESVRGSFDRKEEFTWTAVASQKVAIGGDTSVVVREGAVVVRSKGKRARLQLPSDADSKGFYGFLFSDAGYVEVGALRVTSPPGG